MRQTYYDNIKKPKLQDIQLGILKIYAFYQKIEQRASCPGGSTVGVTYYVFQNIPKNLLVQRRVQLEHISHIKIDVEATYTKTSTPDVY